MVKTLKEHLTNRPLKEKETESGKEKETESGKEKEKKAKEATKTIVFFFFS